MLSNLRHDLRRLVSDEDAERVALSIAAVIDGLWLRSTLSQTMETDSEAARRMASDFVDREIAAARPAAPQAELSRPHIGESLPLVSSHIGGRSVRSGRGRSFANINPATGEAIAEVAIAGADEVDAAVSAARKGQAVWGAMTGAERGRVLNLSLIHI